MISIFDLAALLLVAAALFGWLNRRFIGLSHLTGVLVLSLSAAFLLLALESAFPGRPIFAVLERPLRQVDFATVVMDGMLAFLLFAGAINLDLKALHSRAWPVAFLALIGTVISTALVGGGFWATLQLMGHPLPLEWALVFGALISPTDPVAVLGVLKTVEVPKAVEIEMQGEALFNDGVGIVLFTMLVGIATGNGGDSGGIGDGLLLLAQEAGGGLALGIATGYLAYWAMRAIDDFSVEVLITLALVAGTYAIAEKLGASGPLSIVAAGLVIGDRASRYGMSDKTQGYVSTLWTLIDEVLNSILFLLIGLEVVVLRFAPTTLGLAIAAIPIVLLARLIAVSTPLLLFGWSDRLSARNVPFLTWAGVRGGISVALALSLPSSNGATSIILTATYAVVLFTIIVQGGTLGVVARRTLRIPDKGI